MNAGLALVNSAQIELKGGRSRRLWICSRGSFCCSWFGSGCKCFLRKVSRVPGQHDMQEPAEEA